MCGGYGSCRLCVYLSVPLLQRLFKPTNNDTHGYLLGFSWILIGGFKKKTLVVVLSHNELVLTVQNAS